ncbi:HNH endonuclease signature motif containing protein [Serratia sp. BFP-2025]|uniref:HNH endonuclease signature motif containing protein n=1 Tax=Serratia TaxID=613 RepID=UPI003D7E25D9
MIEYFNQAFEYSDGILIWKNRPLSHFKNERGWRIFNSSYAGKPAGCLSNTGYVFISVNNKNHLAHRIIWAMHHGKIPKGLWVDHINHIRHDNRIANLRLVNASDNQKNTSRRTASKSGTTGVHWDARCKKWCASITARGERRFLGRFENKKAAIAARKEAENTLKFHPNHGSPPRNAQTS